jgi:tRNA(fMet)-specific endonuclease VapC
MLYILDTDHISLLQRGNSSIIARLSLVAPSDRVTTVISLAEQFLGWWSEITRADNEYAAAQAFRFLQDTLHFYDSVTVLPYDAHAVLEFQRLRRARIRIGTQDLRIASIALSRKAAVITRNLRDFKQVPDLMVMDWSLPAV